MLLEVFFDFEGGHATGAGRGDGLAVLAILDVAAGVDAGKDLAVEGAVDIVLGEDIAVFVEIHEAGEGAGVGDVADAEEHEGDGQGGLLAGDAVLEAEAFDILLFDPENLFDEGIGAELDLFVGLGAFEHDGAGAELFGAVDERDLAGEAGEEESLFHGGVATADDGDLLTTGEEAVAGGARADAMADEGLLGGQIEPSGAGTGGDDEGAGEDGFGADLELDGALGEIDGVEMTHAELGAEAGGLLLHVLDELGTLYAFGPAGKVFDQSGDGELSAGLVAFEDEGLEIGAGGVDGGSEAGAAGAEDDGVAKVEFRHRAPLSVNARRGERIRVPIRARGEVGGTVKRGWKGFDGRMEAWQI